MEKLLNMPLLSSIKVANKLMDNYPLQLVFAAAMIGVIAGGLGLNEYQAVLFIVVGFFLFLYGFYHKYVRRRLVFKIRFARKDEDGDDLWDMKVYLPTGDVEEYVLLPDIDVSELITDYGDRYGEDIDYFVMKYKYN